MDPRDAIRDAQLRLRKLAAAATVRAEKSRATVSRLRAEAERLRADHAALAAAARPEAAEAESLLAELDGRLRAAELEVFEAERLVREAEEETRSVAALVPELERAEVRRLAGQALAGGPGDGGAAALALENVRHHIDSLEAEASLGDELRASEVEPPRSAPSPDPRAQLEALKAARSARPPEPATSSSEGPPPSGKSKRTL